MTPSVKNTDTLRTSPHFSFGNIPPVVFFPIASSNLFTITQRFFDRFLYMIDITLDLILVRHLRHLSHMRRIPL